MYSVRFMACLLSVALLFEEKKHRKAFMVYVCLRFVFFNTQSIWKIADVLSEKASLTRNRSSKKVILKKYFNKEPQDNIDMSSI